MFRVEGLGVKNSDIYREQSHLLMLHVCCVILFISFFWGGKFVAGMCDAEPCKFSR